MGSGLEGRKVKVAMASPSEVGKAMTEDMMMVIAEAAEAETVDMRSGAGEDVTAMVAMAETA